MNGDELRQFWPIPEPWSILPITQGVNNLTQVIETPSGSYILRAYRRDRPLERIRYELHVLKSLRAQALPFQVPSPIPTVTGELFAVLSETVLSLSTRLPGSPPPGDHLEQAYAAGEALAELVAALDQLQVEVTSQVTVLSVLVDGAFGNPPASATPPGTVAMTVPLPVMPVTATL